ncbi:hypothetical protein K6611_23265 [Escherichia coli]|nr:hypothetical protein [Escherichia coli]MBZ2228251.1 hypothetical protein [Escherichia coli]MBZ2242050.1 hypothetical protein [Escherichia coli]MBZ2246565.1 hypothetical protein [Escherichia coli]MBZ2251075.1 hypothetical protein [Escherichia coli]MBZ2293326.1 hypothetical protein [Escherichia coli]
MSHVLEGASQEDLNLYRAEVERGKGLWQLARFLPEQEGQRHIRER